MERNPLQAIDPKVIGERLRNARRARGLRQEQVADALGYARTTVVAIEKGERRVTEQELVEFAKHYGRSLSEFVSVQANTQPLVPQFRAAFAASRPGAPLDEGEFLKVAETLETLTNDFLELERLCGMERAKDATPIYKLEESYNHPIELGEEVSVEERGRLGLGDAPSSNLRALLEEAVGLRIFYYEMPQLISGVFACNDVVGGCVGINSLHPVPRGNFSLAHEYAHFLTTRYQADVALEAGRWMRSPTEQFADSFAANFLMPRSGVIRRFSELKDAREGEKNVRIADLVHLSHYFGVSVQAMCLRLEDLRRLPSGTWDRLKARGFKPDRARAVLGLVPHANYRQMLPQRYLILAKRAYDAGLLSEGQLARKLRTDRVTARMMLEKLETLIDDKTGSGYVPVLELDLGAPVLDA